MAERQPGWRARLRAHFPWLDAAGRVPPAPERLSDGYWIYSTFWDEEVEADALIARAPQLARWAAGDALRVAQEVHGASRLRIDAVSMALAEEIGPWRRPSADEAPAPPPASVTVLIDHSGSMKDDRLQLAWPTAHGLETLARKLRLPVQVLGFTTVRWRGAPVRDDWLRAGAPPRPGRLCALRHIVHAPFHPPRPLGLSAMFLPGLPKENVDGEALLWAAERARAAGATRRLIAVLSDGAPVDDSTLLANGDAFLADHLREVLAEFDQVEDLRVLGVGLDYDTSRLYARSTLARLPRDVAADVLPAARAALEDWM
ncbi:MAG: hypothetical protein AAF192_18885 [Pseudomonadota bacterium]